jgi:hypothetical protein
VQRRVRQRIFCIGKRAAQRRHDADAQPVARETRVGIARIVHVANAVRAHIGFDGFARLFEPGPHPSDAVAHHAGGHRGESRGTGAAQRLQQKGFGLIGAVMRKGHHRTACVARHRSQRRVTPCPGPGFDALAARRFAGQALHRKVKRQALR